MADGKIQTIVGRDKVANIVVRNGVHLAWIESIDDAAGVASLRRRTVIKRLTIRIVHVVLVAILEGVPHGELQRVVVAGSHRGLHVNGRVLRIEEAKLLARRRKARGGIEVIQRVRFIACGPVHDERSVVRLCALVRHRRGCGRFRNRIGRVREQVLEVAAVRNAGHRRSGVDCLGIRRCRLEVGLRAGRVVEVRRLRHVQVVQHMPPKPPDVGCRNDHPARDFVLYRKVEGFRIRCLQVAIDVAHERAAKAIDRGLRWINRKRLRSDRDCPHRNILIPGKFRVSRSTGIGEWILTAQRERSTGIIAVDHSVAEVIVGQRKSAANGGLVVQRCVGERDSGSEVQLLRRPKIRCAVCLSSRHNRNVRSIAGSGSCSGDSILKERRPQIDVGLNLLPVDLVRNAKMRVADAGSQGKLRSRLPLVLNVVLLLERPVDVRGNRSRRRRHQLVVLDQEVGVRVSACDAAYVCKNVVVVGTLE